MSTFIKEIKGRIESKKSTIAKFISAPSTMNINRFSGGKFGRMLQLTISNEESTSYIQLTKKQVEQLTKTLNDSFNDNIYPSE